MKILIKIYGERNTGTNYLDHLIRLNLDAKTLRGKVPGFIRSLGITIQTKMPNLSKEYFIFEMFEDVYFKMSSSYNLGWKHKLIIPQSIEEMKQYKNSLYVIILTRNPYSWLLSLHQNPYGPQSIHASFEQFLTEPFKTLKRENHPEPFENPIMLWNEKNKSYIQIKNCLPSIIVKFEDLLLDPESVVDFISGQFKIKRKDVDFKNKTESTKEKDKDFHYYQNYYLKEIWKEKLDKNSINVINHYLDENLLNYFDYKIISI